MYRPFIFIIKKRIFAARKELQLGIYEKKNIPSTPTMERG